MSNERNYTPYINKNKELEFLSGGQLSIDELLAETNRDSEQSEAGYGNSYGKLGFIALSEQLPN